MLCVEGEKAIELCAARRKRHYGMSGLKKGSAVLKRGAALMRHNAWQGWCGHDRPRMAGGVAARGLAASVRVAFFRIFPWEFHIYSRKGCPPTK